METLEFHYTIDTASEGLTIGSFLLSKGYSRRMIAQLKTWPRGILVNEAHVTTRHTLKKGERLTTTIIEEASSENIVPAPLPLRIVYEDRDLMVIHKAAGVPVHPSQNHYDHTLANGLAWYFMQQGRPYICRIINRLDRDTSGLLIAAKQRRNSLRNGEGTSDSPGISGNRRGTAACAGFHLSAHRPGARLHH